MHRMFVSFKQSILVADEGVGWLVFSGGRKKTPAFLIKMHKFI